MEHTVLHTILCYQLNNAYIFNWMNNLKYIIFEA